MVQSKGSLVGAEKLVRRVTQHCNFGIRSFVMGEKRWSSKAAVVA